MFNVPRRYASYDGIVTAKVKRALAEQSYAKLFANWQGVMVGDGELWFSAVGKTGVLRIIAIGFSHNTFLPAFSSWMTIS